MKIPPDQYDDWLNDHTSWRVSAAELLISRNALAAAREASIESRRDNPLPSRVPDAERTEWVEIMLAGFAIENLLKSLWAAKGNKMASGGRTVNFRKDFKPHDLASMAAHFGFAIDPNETWLLDQISLMMVGAGRYPAAISHQYDLGGWADTLDEKMSKLIDRISQAIRVAAGEGQT